MSSTPFRRPAIHKEPCLDRFQKLGLRDNPFPHQPSLNPESDDPRVNGMIYCPDLHADKTKDFRRLLIPTQEYKNPHSIVYLMDHASRKGRGIGKSAFLKHQKDEIMKDLGASASGEAAVVLATYVVPAPHPPCRKFWEFCRLVVSTMIDQGIIAIAVCRLRALSGLVPDKVLDEVGTVAELENTIGNTQWLRERDVKAADLNESVCEKLVAQGIDRDLAFVLSVEGSDSQRLRKEWFVKLGDAFWKTKGGVFAFDSLVKVFETAEFSKGLLLVDEVEKIIMPQNLLERRAFADALRYYLIDGNCENARGQFYGLLLTIHPLIQELLLPHWQAAGLDRLAPLNEPDTKKLTLYFPHLIERMAVPLVKVYLEFYRRSDSAQTGIQPFTEDAVIGALCKSGGLPGKTLSLLNRVIESAAAQSVTEIDRGLVENIALAAEPAVEREVEMQGPLPSAQVNLEE